MKRNIVILLLGIFILTACGTPAPTITPTPLPSKETETPLPSATASPTITLTNTPKPTKYNLTKTPTPDFVNVPTLTPQTPANCPTANLKARFQITDLFKNKDKSYADISQATLDFLNNGGDPNIVVQKLSQNSVIIRPIDLTNDGIEELLIETGSLTILGCANGQYQTFLNMVTVNYAGWSAIPLVIQDLNKNGMPEIVIAQADKTYNQNSAKSLADYTILEWDGSMFASTISGDYTSENQSIKIEDGLLKTIGHSRASTNSITGNWSLDDVDNNGLQDLIILAGVNDPDAQEQLEEKVILKWNGTNYIVASSGIEPTLTPRPTRTPHPFSETCDFRAPELRYNPSQRSTIKDFLDAGGNPEQLKAYYDTTIKDLNNDGLLDVFIINNNEKSAIASMHLFSCEKGAYKDLLNLEINRTTAYIEIITIKDLNQNKLPEIVLKASASRPEGLDALYIFVLYILEWNGENFASLIKDYDNYFYMFYPQNIYLQDTNNDQTIEIVWQGDVPPLNSYEYYEDGPQRLATHVYTWWQGEKYITEWPIKYSEPIYRFQAVQDADMAARWGDYANALRLYRKAIFSDALEWWSEEKSYYLIDKFSNEMEQNGKIIPTPIPDTTEWPKLSAYAYFRMMQIYVKTGKPDEAQKLYGTLLQNYSGDNPGAPYTEMATVFWTEYQASKSLHNACVEIFYYAEQHPQLLVPLGSSYHGIQSQQYEPQDVCPFTED